MTPVEEAAAVYSREPCRRSFLADLELHLMHGYVYSTPAAFIMARPVISTAKAENIVDSAFVFSPDDCDCWHIFLAAGDNPFHYFASLESHTPHDMPFVSFERRNSLRVYRKKDLKTRCLATRISPTRASSKEGDRPHRSRPDSDP